MTAAIGKDWRIVFEGNIVESAMSNHALADHQGQKSDVNSAVASPAQPAVLRGLTVALVVATFILITSGGLVTSKFAGMSVPDWPTSFGRWLLLPVHLWSDLAVLLEHNHRLKGAVGGLLAIAVVVAAFKYRSPFRMLAVGVLVMYIVQGLMGGFRVTEHSTTLALVHGVFGQLVLGACVLMAVFAGRWWHRFIPAHQARPAVLSADPSPARLSKLTLAISVALVGLLVVQLTLGAAVRHHHGASAIPDAPAVYGGVFPPLDADVRARQFVELGGPQFMIPVGDPILPLEAVEASERPNLLQNWEFAAAAPPTTAMLWTHYSHRVMGMVVLPVLLIWMLARFRREPGFASPAEGAAPPGASGGSGVSGLRGVAVGGLRGPAVAMILLFAAQVMLGLSIIWSRKEPYIATGHQAVGAAILAVSVLIAARCHRLAYAYPIVESHAASPKAEADSGRLTPQTA